MGLGAAVVQSGLGQPLRMSFPVSVQRDEEVGCVQVGGRGDDLPGVPNTRTAVVRNGFQTRIEIRSIQPVDEPAVALVVSVGCASPISREYVIFLDPPVIAPTTESSGDAVRPPPPLRTERAAPPRRSSAATTATAAAAAPTPRAVKPAVRKPAAPATSRAPRNRPSVSATPLPAEAPQASSQPGGSAQPTAAAPVPKGDRLTITPTEPPVPGAAVPGTAPVTPAAAPSSAAPPGATTSAVANEAPVVAATGTSPAPGATSDAADAASREQAMRQQQADLQQQIKTLSDQIAAMKLQTATLASRNQALEQSSFSSTVVWVLVLLAVIAIIVAGWMAWRYTQLRRSMEGTAWWTGQGQVPPPDDRAAVAETRSGLVALDPGTRLAPRPSESETAPNASSRSQSNIERPRAAPPRPQRYPTPIDTDFTVSDIEAAMATVRTVSPPRDASRPAALEDSDFAALGGPTVTSAFTDPPATQTAGPSISSAVASSTTQRANPVAHPDANDIGDFVDIDIPPLQPGPSVPQGRPGGDVPLDFKLDIPQSFDPLATDSMKTTIIDRATEPTTVDFDIPHMPNSLDFELPSATQILSLTAGQPDPYAEPVRHGATALDDLFSAQEQPGIDTILNLDERDGSPLSTTEVDRLTTTAVEGPNGEIIPLSTRALLGRFADLMNQVDEVAGTDPLRAIALLRQYVLRDEKIPTLLWLRLFQLYRQVDKKPVYEALAEHFARRYGRAMVAWDQDLADRVPQTPLSAMGQVDTEIEALWGKEEGLERIRSLLCDRDLDDAVVFNAVLQRDLLDAAKVFPRGTDSHIGAGA